MQLFPAVTTLDDIETLTSSLMTELSSYSSDLHAIRQGLDERGASAPLPDGVSVEQVELAHGLNAELITASDSRERIILYFHGGGYCTGSAISHRPLCANIAKQSRWKLLSLSYRLAPEHKFPAALEDATRSYSWLLAQGYQAGDIVFAGDSAGGGLAIATALSILHNTTRNNLPLPAGIIGMSPWLDLDCSSGSYIKNAHIDKLASAQGLKIMGLGYLGDASSKSTLASPFYIEALHGLCSLLLQVGSVETLYDEITSFAEMAKRDGVTVDLQVWENMIHVWQSFESSLPEADQAIKAIAAWLEQV